MPMKISFQGKLYLEGKGYYDLDKVREEIACMQMGRERFEPRPKGDISRNYSPKIPIFM